MGKNHRHSKKLKSEKNKTHIKTKTKFLPKGQNVTNTTFKIKPIILQEQLQEREKTHKRHTNLEELIPKLKHFNDGIRAEACLELKDCIVSKSQPNIKVYLGSVIQNTSGLVQDRDRKVRRIAIKLIHSIFEEFDYETLKPFFRYVLTNLKCAMTNINKQVQEDSLLLLDVILELKNLFLAENFQEFFPNFLTLISKVKQSSERSLSLNLDGKITSVKWRVKVLTRLYGVLKTMTDLKKQEAQNFHPNGCTHLTVKAEQVVFIPIYEEGKFYETVDASLFAGVGNLNSNFDVATLLQLLSDIWMEIAPEKNKKSASSPTVFTTEESVAIFVCIVNILRLLEEYEKMEIFSQLKCLPFLESLMSTFPYSYNRKNLEIAKEFPKCFLWGNDQNCVEENLILVNIFVRSGMKTEKNKTVSVYVNNCLKSQIKISSAGFTYLLQILKRILLGRPFMSRIWGFNMTELVENVVNFYGNKKIPEKFRSDILEILTSPSFVTEKHQQWAAKLPTFLLENHISERLILGILDLCRRGNETVQSGVQKLLPDILENSKNLNIFDCIDVDMALKDFASIFFYLPKLSGQDLDEIRSFILKNPNLELSKHLGDVLDLRSYIK